ncbi:MAG TPA: ECF-type sigma factor [Isosphaeraceae bacterium]|nr:ECF-type sigma factor [Isosphaeraceae bacterium]
MNDVTRILSAIEHGDPQAAEGLLPLVYEALARLAAEDGQAAELVKLRYFAGLSVEEAAQGLGLSRATAYRHWTYARAWVRCEILGEAAPAEE